MIPSTRIWTHSLPNSPELECDPDSDVQYDVEEGEEEEEDDKVGVFTGLLPVLPLVEEVQSYQEQVEEDQSLHNIYPKILVRFCSTENSQYNECSETQTQLCEIAGLRYSRICIPLHLPGCSQAEQSHKQ